MQIVSLGENLHEVSTSLSEQKTTNLSSAEIFNHRALASRLIRNIAITFNFHGVALKDFVACQCICINIICVKFTRETIH